MLVFLIGYMGSGKTSIGKKLAARLGYGFIDTDKEIEQDYGTTIREMFEREGEAYFRERERELLEKLGGHDGNFIVSTGGGMPCRPGNIELMNSAGLTIYLKMGPEKLASRLKGGRDKRPMLKGLNDDELVDFIAQNLEQREPFYGRAAMVLECDDASDEYVCTQAEQCVGWAVKQNAR